jgi:hypothetical protein
MYFLRLEVDHYCSCTLQLAQSADKGMKARRAAPRQVLQLNQLACINPVGKR